MLNKNSKSVLSGTVVLLAVLTVGSFTTVEAQWNNRYDDRYDDRYQVQRYNKNQVKELARRNGYQMGIREGRYDSMRGDRFDVRDSRVYRDGMAGFHRELGYERDYRNAFRDGFEDGYRQGFISSRRNGSIWDRRNDRFPGWNNNNDFFRRRF